MCDAADMTRNSYTRTYIHTGKLQRSIINHLYWCVISTPSGNGELVKAKWLSIDNHIHNVHNNNGELFPHCVHAKLQGSRSVQEEMAKKT